MLLAQVGAAIFQTAFERWTDQPEHADFSVCVREAASELADSLGAVDIPAFQAGSQRDWIAPVPASPDPESPALHD